MADNKEKMKDHVNSADDLIEFVKKKARNHPYHKFYTKEDMMKKMMKRNCLYLSDGNNWNDPEDKNNFQNSDEYKKYGICFSFSKSESVAMWMLYSGNACRGMMIEFNKTIAGLDKKDIKVLVGKWNSEIKDIDQTLEIDPEYYEIKHYDIIYYSKEEDNKVTLKRSDERVEKVEWDFFEDIKKVTKSYPWNYENECRLVILINKSELSRITGNESIDEYNSLIVVNKNLFDKIKKEKKVFYEPNWRGDKNIEWAKESLMNEKINWNLCSDCSKGSAVK